jgi:CheY-like chemotaxis protein
MSTDEPVFAAFCPCQVLVIEDNPDGRETLRQLLELTGYRVDVAADGAEGVQLALARPPRVAVIDIGLPHLDGYQVARRLREALGSKVFLIACTAYSQPEDRRQAREAGFDAYLVKPVDFTILSGCVNQAACEGRA